MTQINPNQPPTGPLKKAATPGARETAPLPKQAGDAMNISVDARVRMGKDDKPELVLDGLTVDGADALARAEVEKNMKGRRKGVREQITQQVVQQIAEQVAIAIAPMLEQKLEDALVAEKLPASLADDLARQAMPEIAKVIAAKLAEKAKVSYSIGF